MVPWYTSSLTHMWYTHTHTHTSPGGLISPQVPETLEVSRRKKWNWAQANPGAAGLMLFTNRSALGFSTALYVPQWPVSMLATNSWYQLVDYIRIAVCLPGAHACSSSRSSSSSSSNTCLLPLLPQVLCILCIEWDDPHHAVLCRQSAGHESLPGKHC